MSRSAGPGAGRGKLRAARSSSRHASGVLTSHWLPSAAGVNKPAENMTISRTDPFMANTNELTAKMPKNNNAKGASGMTPAMGWSVKGNGVVNLFFSFLFCAMESCVAFWIVSSGRAPATRPGLTCYPYILCGVHYIVSNPARGAHGDQSLNRAIQRPRGQYGLRYAPKVSCDLYEGLVGRVLR